MENTYTIEISTFLDRAEALAKGVYEEDFLFDDELSSQTQHLIWFVEDCDGTDFSIEVACGKPYEGYFNQQMLAETARAIKFALLDWFDEESKLCQDILGPLLQFGQVHYRKIHYLEDIIAGICKAENNLRSTTKIAIPSEKTWLFEASASGADYFRFSLPVSRAMEVWSYSDLHGIEHPGSFFTFNLMELGHVNIIQYALGAYYVHLATFCPEPEKNCKRPFSDWKFGVA